MKRGRFVLSGNKELSSEIPIGVFTLYMKGFEVV
jgi:hypothetical protein